MIIEKITSLPAGAAISYVWENKLYPVAIHLSENGRFFFSPKIVFNRHGRIDEFPQDINSHQLFSIHEYVRIDESTRFKEGFYTMKFKDSKPNTLRLNHFDGHSLNSLKEALKIHEEVLTGYYLPNGHNIVQIWNHNEGFLIDNNITINTIDELIHTD